MGASGLSVRPPYQSQRRLRHVLRALVWALQEADADMGKTGRELPELFVNQNKSSK